MNKLVINIIIKNIIKAAEFFAVVEVVGNIFVVGVVVSVTTLQSIYISFSVIEGEL